MSATCVKCIVAVHHKYITVHMLYYKLDMESELSQYLAAHSPTPVTLRNPLTYLEAVSGVGWWCWSWGGSEAPY